MTKGEILRALEKRGETRQWLAERAGYAYDYVKNSLAPSGGAVSPKFGAACERVFLEAERSGEAPASSQGVWDMVYFSGGEVATIDRARRAGGYADLPALYRDAVIDFADRLLEREGLGILKVEEQPLEYRNKQAGE